MKVLVVNAGSSSLKYQFIDMQGEKLLAKGLCDRIGISGAFVKYRKTASDPIVIEQRMKDHRDAIQLVIKTLMSDKHGVIKSMDEISAVGHRVVHGGEKFSSSVVIDDEVMDTIRECIDIAPLHNPPNIIGIDACKAVMPNTPMVAVFDTAFHQTIPQHAYMYALPYELYEKYKIRRYGFHGTSHKFISERAADLLGKSIEDLKLVTCHLGNGSSIAAVDGGKSVDTSMGFTPLEGLAMGTRSGTVDPAVVTFLMDNEKLDAAGINSLLNKKSGVLGISGISNDFRDLDTAMQEGNERARLALEMFCYQVRRYIGDYTAVMGGLDAVVFAGGIGENNPFVRYHILKDLGFFGIELDEDANDNAKGVESVITKAESRTKVLVVPTNEELAIARETVTLI